MKRHGNGDGSKTKETLYRFFSKMFNWVGISQNSSTNPIYLANFDICMHFMVYFENSFVNGLLIIKKNGIFE